MNRKLPQPDGHIPNFSALLYPTPRGARLARPLATAQLPVWGFPLDPTQLIVAQPAGNAAAHGRVPGRSFRLLLHVAGTTLRIGVTDTRRDRFPHRRPAAPTEESGRGLTLVSAPAARWGVIPGLPPRKTVRAELTFAAPQTPAPDGLRSGRTCAPYELLTGEKEPSQAPPLPPAGQTHSRE
ncbi:ATP-binding protein [Streptomyces sp. MS06]|uniref:ATP-binding protein n=1 Tax=Streptomyces sp. MS06 TaxID=3385974 RepID=UPI0039A065C3